MVVILGLQAVTEALAEAADNSQPPEAEPAILQALAHHKETMVPQGQRLAVRAVAAAQAAQAVQLLLKMAVMRQQILLQERQSLILVAVAEQTLALVELTQVGQQAQPSRVLLELQTLVAAAVVVDFVGILFRRFPAVVPVGAAW